MPGTGPAPLGASNPRIKQLRRLSGRRSARTEAGAVLVEGAGLIVEALDAGTALHALYVRDGSAQTPAVAAVLERASARGAPCASLAPTVFDGLASTVSPQPVLAVIGWRPAGIADLPGLVAAGAADEAPLWFVLDEVADPGNAGALVRVAEAAGVHGVVVAGGVDVTNPKVVRAAAGALFRVPVVEVVDAANALDALDARGVAACATVATAGTEHDLVAWVGGWAVVLGNEAHGVAPALLARSLPVTIAMAGRVESLNVATAGAVIAFEARRQRRRGAA